MKVVLVCSNGISSGLLVRRILKAAKENNIPDFEITSVGYEALDTCLDQCNLVLIAPVGRTIVNKTVDKCKSVNKDYEVISSEDYEAINADNILEQILEKAGDNEGGISMNALKKEDLENIAMRLISKGGEARSLAMEAIYEAKDGNIAKADELLEESETALTEGHTTNAQLLWAEANNTDIKLSILLIHSLDHIMNAQTVVELAREIVEIYRNRTLS